MVIKLKGGVKGSEMLLEPIPGLFIIIILVPITFYIVIYIYSHSHCSSSRFLQSLCAVIMMSNNYCVSYAMCAHSTRWSPDENSN